MIVFDLHCAAGGHRFEGWFASSAEFAAQSARGLLACPHCGSADIAKAPMAANLARKGNRREAASDAAPPAIAQARAPTALANLPLAPAARKLLEAVAAAQASALATSRWVGSKFAEDARAIHYGEAPDEVIHGNATAQEAADLHAEGIAAMPLLVPVIAPEALN